VLPKILLTGKRWVDSFCVDEENLTFTNAKTYTVQSSSRLELGTIHSSVHMQLVSQIQVKSNKQSWALNHTCVSAQV